ncbi:putative P-loop containing nucleoside triphosphate hydrolase protein [Lyophyllum shimeji]|uniref:DNA 3'-5' helicase n=1 Tax=Lyophyllum shimeji TaxID=47721 RepID=A0A9P3PUC2_LYOSH|nr:putative P-loop containing nucleoside triphosphate hydrolase protein [Lyophyllum shimeji]
MTLATDARRERHLQQVARSTANLEKAREGAKAARGYCSATTRAKLSEEFSARMNQRRPYDWQVDVAEALILGLDCTVIAGTGAGKTMPFVMPLFVEPKKVVIIISPLNALEEDQRSRFTALGLDAAAVNGETYNKQLHKDIETGKYQVLVTSPEMCLQHEAFRQLLSTAKFARRIGAIIVDEAHCITQWGKAFRTEYSRLGSLRAFVPTKPPVLLTSATLTPLSLAQARITMNIDSSTSYHVNQGVDRPNIKWSVRRMPTGKDLESLAFLIPPDVNHASSIIPSTMVFFDDINLSMAALLYLQNKLPTERRHEITVYNSRRTVRAKQNVMAMFREGRIRILLTTEAAGMGCDIPHVVRVVQFMVPHSLDSWMQRGGRAGRDPSQLAQAILLVQPTVFQEVSRQNSETTEVDEPQYRKAIEDGLRQWIEAPECRRDIVDEYYDSGVERKAPTSGCCDNCSPEEHVVHSINVRTPPVNDESQSTQLPIDPTIFDEVLDDDVDKELELPLSVSINLPGNLPVKRPRKQPSLLPVRRTKEHLLEARGVLEKWRRETWLRDYSSRPWGPELLLPANTLKIIASLTTIHSIEALIEVGKWTSWRARQHGHEVLRVLHDVDERERERRISEKKRKVAVADALKQQRTADRLAKKEAEKLQRAEEKKSQPKKPRASRARGRADVENKENVPNVVPMPMSPFVGARSHVFMPMTPPPPSTFTAIPAGIPMPPPLQSPLAVPPIPVTPPPSSFQAAPQGFGWVLPSPFVYHPYNYRT